MRKIIFTFAILLIIQILSGLYRNDLIISFFPENHAVFLKITSNLTSIINSLIGALIYVVIFYFAYNLLKVFEIVPAKDLYLFVINEVLRYICIVEVLKIVNTYLFLKDSLYNIIPNEVFNEQLKTTLWFKYNTYIEFAALVLLPIYVFIVFKRNNETTRISLASSLSIILGFIIFNLTWA